MSICTYICIWLHKYEYFLEHKLSVLSPVRPLRAACATSPGAGCSLCVFSQCMVSLEKKWINFIWLSNHAFTLKTILISRLKIFPFRFAVGITWRSETLYTQECSASPLQDFSMPSSVTEFPAIVPRGQLLAPSTRVMCGHWLLHHCLFSPDPRAPAVLCSCCSPHSAPGLKSLSGMEGGLQECSLYPLKQTQQWNFAKICLDCPQGTCGAV